MIELSKTEISFLERINIKIDKSTLTIVSTSKSYNFNKLESLEIKIEKLMVTNNSSLFKNLFSFPKFLDANYNKDNGAIKTNIFLNLKNEYRILINSCPNSDLISTTKIVAKLNKEISNNS